MVKKTVADILVEQGAISTQQLNECQSESKKSGIKVEQCLLDKKFVSAEDIAKAYANYASLQYVETITEEMADIELMTKAPFAFLRNNIVIPIKHNGQVVIVTANPMDFQPLDELNLFFKNQAIYAVSTAAIITNAINRYYPLEGSKEVIEELEEEASIPEEVSFEEIDEKDIMLMAAEAPVIKLVNQIIFQAVKQRASDIHIEPFEKEIRVRYRIDGVMYDIMSPPKRIQGALVSRIKIMSHLDIAVKRVPQDGRIAIKVSDKAIDIRVSILPVSFGERVAMRLLDKSRTVAALEDLQLSERDYAVLIKAIERPNGIVYVTGPTGSGKTTTLYSVLGRLNKENVNVITVEDPVEYQMSGVSQVQVQEKTGMTFAAALRSILRQDPDIIMIGETRDLETAEIAIRAALTGHLVLSTLHTNDAPSAITRLVDMGIEPFLIASSVTAVLAQRLVRKLCDSCKKPYTPPAELLEKIKISQQEASQITFYEPVGCDQCTQTGYQGRLAIFEVMEMTPGVAALTMKQADTSVLREKSVADGMTLLVDDGIRSIKQGTTTIDEVLSVAVSEEHIAEQS